MTGASGVEAPTQAPVLVEVHALREALSTLRVLDPTDGHPRAFADATDRRDAAMAALRELERLDLLELLVREHTVKLEAIVIRARGRKVGMLANRRIRAVSAAISELVSAER